MKKLRDYWNRVISIKRSPQAIATGFGIGTFLAILPLASFAIIIGLILALFIPRMSKISFLAAFVVWNPFVTASLYVASYNIGRLFLGSLNGLAFRENILSYTGRFLLGNVIIAAVLGLISYGLVFWAANAYQKKFAH